MGGQHAKRKKKSFPGRQKGARVKMPCFFFLLLRPTSGILSMQCSASGPAVKAPEEAGCFFHQPKMTPTLLCKKKKKMPAWLPILDPC